MMRIIGIFFGIILLVGVFLSASFFWDAYMISPEEGVESVEFIIEPGMSVSAIAQTLHEQEMISSPFFFKAYVKLFGNASGLQAGTFELTPGMSLQMVAAALTHAEASETQVTIPEGYTAAQIGAVAVETFVGINEEDWEMVSGEQGTWSVQAADIAAGIPEGQGLEGYLFPDTYRFRDDVSAQTIVDTMVLTLKRRMSENGITVPTTLVFDNGMTLHELMTLASIVEREVQSAEDMKIVAGIFHTRLKIGMALQADSTVNYVTGKKTPGISLADTKLASPYNTYQNLGLPPGPISNPGMNAILAVLNPTDSDYLYFLTTPEGKVIYASTFDQHVANKFQYLK